MYFHREARLIYLAHPRTASIATADALQKIGFEMMHEHHGRLRCLPIADEPNLRTNWYAFTVVRNHFDTAVSWVFRRTHGRREITKEVYEQMLTSPGNRWVELHTMWHLHSNDADFIIRYENLEEELNCILQSAHLPKVELKKKNVSVGRDGRHYSEFYNSQTRDYIENRFGNEIRRFGYEYEPVPRLRHATG